MVLEEIVPRTVADLGKEEIRDLDTQQKYAAEENNHNVDPNDGTDAEDAGLLDTSATVPIKAVGKVQYEEEAVNDFEYHSIRKPKMPKKTLENLRSRLKSKERLDESNPQRNPTEPVAEPMEAFEELMSVVEGSAEAMKKAGAVIESSVDTKDECEPVVEEAPEDFPKYKADIPSGWYVVS